MVVLLHWKLLNAIKSGNLKHNRFLLAKIFFFQFKKTKQKNAFHQNYISLQWIYIAFNHLSVKKKPYIIFNLRRFCRFNQAQVKCAKSLWYVLGERRRVRKVSTKTHSCGVHSVCAHAGHAEVGLCVGILGCGALDCLEETWEERGCREKRKEEGHDRLWGFLKGILLSWRHLQK